MKATTSRHRDPKNLRIDSLAEEEGPNHKNICLFLNGTENGTGNNNDPIFDSTTLYCSWQTHHANASWLLTFTHLQILYSGLRTSYKPVL
jgi:hypothetical protein